MPQPFLLECDTFVRRECNRLHGLRMRPPASAHAVEAVLGAVAGLRSKGVASTTPPSLFEAANAAAWDAGLMLSQADVWQAVYEWAGHDYDDPPPDDTLFELT